ncbi:MAG: hypothetical protein HY238_02870 [Acidobacteria bacterium]|nr:hypothetical protein [Acidobacteriota bacterium]
MSDRSRFLWLLALPMEAGYLALNRLGDLQRFVVEYIAIALVVFLFYIVSCHSITRFPLAFILFAGLAFRLTLLPLYPSLTDDPHRYRWEAKLQAAGGNPYTERPEDPRWSALRDPTWHRVNRKDLPTGYGPLLEWSYRLTYAAVSRLSPDEFLQIRLFKIPYLFFDLATAAVLLGLLNHLGLPRQWVLVYFWSPLVIVEFWASGHNDSLLLFFLVAAVWAGCAGRWTLAMGALWMATLAKFWPALLFPLFLRSGARLRSALAWTPLVAVLSIPYLHGASQLRRMLAGFLGGWRNNASLFNFLYAWAGDYERAKPVVAVLVVLAVLAIAWRRPPLIQGALWTAVALLLLSANCFPWYLTWLVPLLAVVPHPALLLWTGLVPLAYHILIGYEVTRQWLEDPFFLWLEYVPVYALLAVAAIAGRPLGAAAGPPAGSAPLHPPSKAELTSGSTASPTTAP